MTAAVTVFEISTATFSGYVLHGYINKLQRDWEKRQAAKLKASYNATRKRIALLEHNTETGFSNDTIDWLLKQKIRYDYPHPDRLCLLCKNGVYFDASSLASRRNNLNIDIRLRQKLCSTHLKSVKAVNWN